MSAILKAISTLMILAAAAPSQGQSIVEALDNDSLPWTVPASSTTAWSGQSDITHDGIDAARSGIITHSQNSHISATVTGPGTLSFWWRVSSESDQGNDRHDILSFWYDTDSGHVAREGEGEWEQVTHSIPEGEHTLNWRYAKDASGSAGLDSAFLDQVVWTPVQEDFGELLWEESSHFGINHNYVRGVALDRRNNLVAAGYFHHAGTNPAASNAHILALDGSDGQSMLWDDEVNGVVQSVDRYYAIHRDPQGNLIVAGTINGPSYPPYHNALLLRKHAPNGDFLWEERFYRSPWGEISAIDTDSDGNIYVSGRDFGGWTVHEGQWCILKYDPEGGLYEGFPILYNFQSYPDSALALSVGDDGSIYASGYISVLGTTNYNWHVRAYNPDRTLRWTDTIAGTASTHDLPYGSVFDDQGHLYVVGRIDNGSGNEMLVVKYLVDTPGPAAERVWEKIIPNSHGQYSAIGLDVAIGPDKSIYVAGQFDNEVGNQAALVILDPQTAHVRARRVADLPVGNFIQSIDIRDGLLGYGGIRHNGTDWDYLYGMIVLHPGPHDTLGFY